MFKDFSEIYLKIKDIFNNRVSKSINLLKWLKYLTWENNGLIYTYAFQYHLFQIFSVLKYLANIKSKTQVNSEDQKEMKSKCQVY